MQNDAEHGALILSADELQEIEGGRTLAYWVGYFIGEAVHGAIIIGDGVNEGNWAAWHA